MFKNRSYKPELLDNEDIPTEDLYQNLRELDFINTWLDGHKVVLAGIRHFKKYLNKPNIYEIGSGGGDNLRAINNFLKKEKIEANLTGIDLKEDCVKFAEKSNPQITFQISDYRNADFSKAKPDIIFNSLFCHHFTDPQLIEMLKWMNENSTIGFFICDLHRHPLAYYSIKILTQLFSKSYLVKNDAPLSVLRGFKKKEWVDLLEKAEIKNYKIVWKWAFRWLIVVKRNKYNGK